MNIRMKNGCFSNATGTASAQNQYHSIPDLVHQGRYIMREKSQMLNMSSNDYLGLASNENLRQSFTAIYDNFLLYQFFIVY